MISMDGAEFQDMETGSGRLATTVEIERVTRTELVGKTGLSVLCRGCYRRQIRVRLSYYGNQDFNEGSGRSSRSDSAQTGSPDGRPTRRKGGGWAHCVDATKQARTESKYCR